MTDEQLLQQTIAQILPVDAHSRAQCLARWDELGKPLHSLGKLEKLWAQLAAIRRTPQPSVKKRALVVMCADNGVVAEGVSQTGSEVTATVAENFFDGRTVTAIWCKKNHCETYIVDIGMATDTPRTIRKKVAYGTRNMVYEPAMTRAEALRAIAIGIAMARQLADEGYELVATGEMGIGNTTTSSAVAAVLLGLSPEQVTGRGAGLSDEGLGRKRRAIAAAIEKNRPNAADPLDVLAKVGGFDLAGLTGICLGGAACGLAVVTDGLISLAAALLAARLAPACVPYLVASHASAEPAAEQLQRALGLQPGLQLGLCLGEGSGAVALLPLLDLTAAAYEQMQTFAGIHVEKYEDYTK